MSRPPPLVALMEGRRARPRKASQLRPREITLHLGVARILRDPGARNGVGATFPPGRPETGRRALG